MDPIECAKVNGSQYCWVQGNAGEKGTEEVLNKCRLIMSKNDPCILVT